MTQQTVSPHYSGMVEVNNQRVQTEPTETKDKCIQAGKVLHKQGVYSKFAQNA